MPYVFENQPFLTRETKVGISVANHVVLSKHDRTRKNGAEWDELTHGELVYYPYLRKWLIPILDEQILSLSAISCEPRDLPHVIRILHKTSKTTLVVNTFPTMGKSWIFTTKGLFESEKLINYTLDQLSNPANHQICTPTALRRLGLTSKHAFTGWQKDIENLKPSRPYITPSVTSHVMAIHPLDEGYFSIGDQYGIGIISNAITTSIAEARKSFAGNTHLLEVIQ